MGSPSRPRGSRHGGLLQLAAVLVVAALSISSPAFFGSCASAATGEHGSNKVKRAPSSASLSSESVSSSRPPTRTVRVCWSATSGSGSGSGGVAGTANSYSKCPADITASSPSVVATASYDPSFAERGYGELWVSTSDSHPDDVQLYGAGYAEGYLTAGAVALLHTRISGKRASKPSAYASLRNFVARQLAFMKQEVGRHASASASSFTSASSYSSGGRRSGSGGLLLGSVGEGLELTWAEYWHLVGTTLSRVEGLTAGYNARAHAEGLPPLTVMDVMLLNYDGDAMDVLDVAGSGAVSFGPSETLVGAPRFAREAASSSLAGRKGGRSPSSSLSSQQLSAVSRSSSLARVDVNVDANVDADTVSNASPGGPASASGLYDRESWIQLSRRGHCSALVRAVPSSPNEILVGHTTWSDYYELVRVWKHYHHPLQRATTPSLASKTWSFSSYAGMVTSTDDWYVLSSGLLVTETSLSAAKAGALASIAPEAALPSWMRVTVANAAARTAKEWGRLFAVFNGGTYNCAWLVVDYRVLRDGAQHSSSSSSSSSSSRTTSGSLRFAADSTSHLKEASSSKGASLGNSASHSSADLTGTVVEFSAQGGEVLTETGGMGASGASGASSMSSFESVSSKYACAPCSGSSSAATGAASTSSSAPSGGAVAVPWLAGKRGVFWLVEQSPKRVLGRDMTAVLACRGFWPSVNRPFFSLIRSDLGYPPETCSDTSSATTEAEYFSFERNPRGRIFTREAHKVSSTASMLEAVRFNKYNTDSLSEGEPFLAPSARFDLASSKHRAAVGGVDSKVIDAAGVSALQSLVVYGPAWENVPAFDWREWDKAGKLPESRCGPATANQLGPHVSTDILQELDMPCLWKFHPAQVSPRTAASAATSL